MKQQQIYRGVMYTILISGIFSYINLYGEDIRTSNEGVIKYAINKDLKEIGGLE